MKKGIIAITLVAILSWTFKGCVQHQETSWCNGATVTVQEGWTKWDGVITNCWGDLETAMYYISMKYGSVEIGDIVQFPNGKINP